VGAGAAAVGGVRRARFMAAGEAPNSRWNARRMRSGSLKPLARATSCTERAPLSSMARAASARSRSTALAGVTPVSS